MPGCVLRISGRGFDGEKFLSGSRLASCWILRTGKSVRHVTDEERNFLNFDVSRTDGDLVHEVADAVAFLDRYKEELQRLRALPGIEGMRLDFGCWQKEVPAHSSYLPPELLSKAGKLGVGIELSFYAREET